MTISSIALWRLSCFSPSGVSGWLLRCCWLWWFEWPIPFSIAERFAALWWRRLSVGVDVEVWLWLVDLNLIMVISDGRLMDVNKREVLNKASKTLLVCDSKAWKSISKYWIRMMLSHFLNIHFFLTYRASLSPIFLNIPEDWLPRALFDSFLKILQPY